MAKNPPAHTPPSHTKVTRQDWVDMALSSLDEEPIDQLKVLTLARRLDVSRSSFYWYFENLTELQDDLLAIWRHNTESIVERSRRRPATVVAAVLGVFECWADQGLYDARLDLAVRDWGRRDRLVAQQVAAGDEQRLLAIAEMFARYGFDEVQSRIRARLVYHSQVGYYALGTTEPVETRLLYLPYYLEAMAGRAPTVDEMASFEAFLATVNDIR